ncbi:uncharacterized protein RCC_03467 [Ramularia collo-cygni]|uniref:Uncharacterized protein n=1 Tax=Ramularia collo-cygni TaxID=112498 RepID=A0A2D3UWV4_9PEZI|nr:uncharacterized protein RCC_03467 [Ramularia collo-cygni]CZT17630.1 uncharacterized protein RCC_03467 [Ramularia collo-cygni]
MATKQSTSMKPMMENNSVAGGRLGFFHKGTGFYRDGFCRTGSEDSGNHSVAATVSKGFLDFSNSKGNNLGSLSDGQKWCLCASRWQEAMKAAQAGKLAHEDVPKVHLHATHEKALDVVSYKELKQYAAQGEATSQQGRQEAHHNPESQGGLVKESKEIGSAQPSIAPGQGSHWNGGSMTESSGSRG